MVPVRSLLTIASSEDRTIAASICSAETISRPTSGSSGLRSGVGSGGPARGTDASLSRGRSGTARRKITLLGALRKGQGQGPSEPQGRYAAQPRLDAHRRVAPRPCLEPPVPHREDRAE